MSFNFDARSREGRAMRLRAAPSRLAFLVLLLFALPGFSRAATLEDSARNLAQQLGASLSASQGFNLEVRNASSLRPNEVAQIEKALRDELQNLQDRSVETHSTGAVRFLVTLSENPQGFVWTAEIHAGDGTEEPSTTVVITVPRSSNSQKSAATNAMILRADKLWEGPERILDAQKISTRDGKSWLALLLSDGLKIQDLRSGSINLVPIVSTAERDPQGILEQRGDGAVALMLAPQICTVALDTASVLECRSGKDPGPSRGPAPDLAPDGPLPPGKGEFFQFQECGTNYFFATGPNDDTQTDSLQAFQNATNAAEPVSNELNFPGPITALHAAMGTPRVIVRNLKTGNYEAYYISVVSCSP